MIKNILICLLLIVSSCTPFEHPPYRGLIREISKSESGDCMGYARKLNDCYRVLGYKSVIILRRIPEGLHAYVVVDHGENKTLIDPSTGRYWCNFDGTHKGWVT